MRQAGGGSKVYSLHFKFDGNQNKFANMLRNNVNIQQSSFTMPFAIDTLTNVAYGASIRQATFLNSK